MIPYCQGGYRSAHTYLALRLIGYPRVRNYLGSWGEWGNRLDLPIETSDLGPSMALSMNCDGLMSLRFEIDP